MSDLIQRVSQKTGLSRDMSQKAVDAIGACLKKSIVIPFPPARREKRRSNSLAPVQTQPSNQFLRIQDEERRRIARNLHDSAGQTLVVLALNLSRLEEVLDPQSPPGRILADCQTLLKDVTREVRTVSYLLHPPLLDEFGLPSALQSYIDGFTARSGIKTKLLLSPNFGRLPSDMEIAIFRVVQECFTNIHRHSGSASAEVELVRGEDGVRLEVRDRGKGIPIKKKLALLSHRAAGVGLRGMSERISEFGGILEIRSDSGTTVSAFLPLKDLSKSSLAAGREITLESWKKTSRKESARA